VAAAVRCAVTVAWSYQMTAAWLKAAGVAARDITSAAEAAVPKLTYRIRSAAISTEFGVAAVRAFDDAVPRDIGGVPFADMINAEQYFGVKWDGQKGVGTYNVNRAVGKLDSLLSTLATTPANAMDGKLSDAVRNMRFGGGDYAPGFDLATAHLFRGRDVGLKSYSEVAKCYGLAPDSKVRDAAPLLRCACRTPAAREWPEGHRRAAVCVAAAAQRADRWRRGGGSTPRPLATNITPRATRRLRTSRRNSGSRCCSRTRRKSASLAPSAT
jgi:Animal haem peroxidase